MNMNKYKSLILIGLFAVGFSSCQTEDLQKDIDALKERVEDFEMQVQRLNDEMNIIRVLLDGNKTISSYTQNGDKYTLTLSNGETIELTQGQDGKNYPSISIGSNRNWFINGNDTGNKAEAEDGKETEVTPQFKIENDTWRVSYDGGKTYEDLKVPAIGEPEGKSPIDDFKPNDDGSEFTFTINGKPYVIPVVKGLICEILNEQESYVVERGNSIGIKVKVAKGDLVRAIVPAEWKATVSNYTDLTDEQELIITVTAPNISSKCVLSVEVTSGVNTASDEVTLRTATTSYYDDYMAGLDIQIGNVTINKFTHGEANLVESGTISTDGVYFVKTGATGITLKAGGYGKLIVIGEQNGQYSDVGLGGTISVGSINDKFGVAFKGIKFGSAASRVFSLSSEVEVKNLIIDNCDFTLNNEINMSYLYDSQWKSSLDNLYMISSRVGIGTNKETTNDKGAVTVSPVELWNCRAGKFSNVEIKNNIIYCNVENTASILTIVLSGKDTNTEKPTGEVVFDNLKIENNTFVNVLGNNGGTNSGMARTSMTPKCTMKNNLFWYVNERTGTVNGGWELRSHLMQTATYFSTANMGNNVVYSGVADATKLIWGYFRTEPSNNIEAGFKNNITLETVNPFTDGTVTNEGKFTYTEEFKAKGIGADIQ